MDDDNLLRLEEFKKSYLYQNYKFNRDDLDKIKIDLTFLETAKKKENVSSVELAKYHLILYPEIKPLMQVVKRFLQIKGLGACFNGIIYSLY